MRKIFTIAIISLLISCNPKLSSGLRKRDLKKDVELTTNYGRMLIRLYDQTPLHRNNFLKLVKEHFYDSIAFHRVIQSFMVQAGDPATKKPGPDATSSAANYKYTLPAEFRDNLFHKKGVIAAARLGDDINPKKESSGTQFYIVQGKRFTDAGLDSLETIRLKGRKLPADQRAVYRSLGGTPHLDQHYTVFGEVIEGTEVIDNIAAQPTLGQQGANKPVREIYILIARLVKRKR